MKSPTYTPEFRAEAVKLVLTQGLTLEEAAQRIAMSKGTMANWVSAAKRGTDPKAPPGSRRVAELEAEVAKLRKELAVERMEKDLLEQTFAPTRPNEAWVSEITYVATDEGWLYLAGIKDVFTCEMAAYALGPRMTQELTAQALWRAVRGKRPALGLILHSDPGSQYCADDYRKLVAQFGMQASISRKGNCYDNAPKESFWGA